MYKRQAADGAAPRSRPPLVFANTYGVTEATVYNTFAPLRPEDARQQRESTACAGWPLDGVRIALAVPVDGGDGSGEGEVWIGGVQVGVGYHNRPDLTSQSFVRRAINCPAATDGLILVEKRRPTDAAVDDDEEVRWFRTGDIGVWDDTHGLRVLGRRDAQIKLHLSLIHI